MSYYIDIESPIQLELVAIDSLFICHLVIEILENILLGITYLTDMSSVLPHIPKYLLLTSFPICF